MWYTRYKIIIHLDIFSCRCGFLCRSQYVNTATLQVKYRSICMFLYIDIYIIGMYMYYILCNIISNLQNSYRALPNIQLYAWLVCICSRSFPHSWLITGCVTRLTRRVPLVGQELLSLPERLSSPPVFRRVRVTRSLVLCVCFVDRCLSFYTFSFGHCVVRSSSIYGFWFNTSEYPFGIFKLFL